MNEEEPEPVSPDILTESVVLSKSAEPAVHLKWGDREGELSVEEAITFARDVLDAAAHADQDAVLIKFLIRRMTMSVAQAGAFVADLGEFRQTPEATEAINLVALHEQQQAQGKQ